jgi:hypothetical protein
MFLLGIQTGTILMAIMATGQAWHILITSSNTLFLKNDEIWRRKWSLNFCEAKFQAEESGASPF